MAILYEPRNLVKIQEAKDNGLQLPVFTIAVDYSVYDPGYLELPMPFWPRVRDCLNALEPLPLPGTLDPGWKWSDYNGQQKVWGPEDYPIMNTDSPNWQMFMRIVEKLLEKEYDNIIFVR